MSANITKRQAERCQRLVSDYLGESVTLYPPGFHADGWTLALEGSYDWPLRISDATFSRTLVLPTGVFAEPVSGWCLGLYPL